jgi:hypothetical protein
MMLPPFPSHYYGYGAPPVTYIDDDTESEKCGAVEEKKKYSVYDRVRCVIEGKELVLTIVGRKKLSDNTEDYIAYVPSEDAHGLHSAYKINAERAVSWGVHKKYVGELGVFIYCDDIAELKYHADGLICSRCGEFVGQAEPNQEDGSFKCYSCRNDPFR